MRLTLKAVVAFDKKADRQRPQRAGRTPVAGRRRRRCFARRNTPKPLTSYRVAYKRWPDSPLGGGSDLQGRRKRILRRSLCGPKTNTRRWSRSSSRLNIWGQVTERRFAIGRYWEAQDRAHPKFVLSPNLTDRSIPRFDTGGHAPEGLRTNSARRSDRPACGRCRDGHRQCLLSQGPLGRRRLSLRPAAIRVSQERTSVPGTFCWSCAANCCVTKVPDTKARNSMRPKTWLPSC